MNNRVILASVLLLLILSASAFGQISLPPPSDPWWQSKTGKAFAAQVESWLENWATSTNPTDRYTYEQYFTGTHDCFRTTMDGLPACVMPKMTSIECLKVGPPDEVGGYCDWYGYSTLKQEDRFERKRGYERVKHQDGTGDTWKKIQMYF